MDLNQLWGIGAIPVIVALIEVVKPWVQDTKLYPIIAIVLAIVWNILVGITLAETNIGTAALLGIIIGLSASGLYSSAKTYGIVSKKEDYYDEDL